MMTLTPMWKKDLVLWLKEMFVLSKETYELGEYADIKATLEWIDNFESLLQSLALLCKFGPQGLSFEKICKELIKQRMPFEMRHNSVDVSKAFELCKRLINGCLSNELSLYQTEEVWRDILCTVDSRTIQNLLERQQIDEIHQYTEPIDWKELVIIVC